ncbi:MAG: type I polyketide synthase, partial [Waterburya sp.]
SFVQFFLTEYQEQLIEFYATSAAVDDPVQESQPLTTNSSQISSNEVLVSPQIYEQEAIAVIGMSGMMPNSPDLETFWQNLWAGQDLISEIPEDRWDWQDIYGDALSGGNQTKVKWGGFMPEVDKFDPTFFGISRREANLMDPQQRLFLETVWKTIENAGYKASDLAGSKTGLFVGVFSEDYSELLYKSDKAAQAHAITGSTPSILANRISFLLDLRGPSIPINTACSSSLIALHQAIEAIHSGSCSQAIVGGVNVMVSSTPFIATSKAGMLCEDGRCKTFDKRANGYVRGEGVGAVWLKPLSQAVADGDYIHGVIRGTAANHGGAANSLTSPNPEAQADVLVQAYQRAKVDPRRVNYIEAHGTGTSLGDPVEINGIKKAFGQLFAERQLTMPQKPYCGIGTVKSSIGHLEAAAGIAGLIKVLLAMKQGKLHGNIHFQELNPYIQLEDSPFYLVTKNQ